MSNWRYQMAGIGEIVPDNDPFREQFGGGMGHLAPHGGKSHAQTIHPMNYKYCLVYISRHDFATAVKGATSEQLRDRVGCAFPIYLVQGVRSAGLQLAPLIYAGL